MATITDTTTDANGNIIINVSSSADDAITLATAGTYSDKNIIFNLTTPTETDPTVPAWAKAASKPSYTASEVGLGNVDNVKQYSASNPPPYPVTSVNGQTGDVTVESGAKPNTVKVTLTASGWDSTTKTQTVTATGVLADETAQLIQPTPALVSQTAYYEAGILCTGQAADSLTFTADKVPTKNLLVYVIIQDLAPSDSLIHFTIDGADYWAEDGMTWGEWINSAYNTSGFKRAGNTNYASCGAATPDIDSVATASSRANSGDVLFHVAAEGTPNASIVTTLVSHTIINNMNYKLSYYAD